MDQVTGGPLPTNMPEMQAVPQGNFDSNAGYQSGNGVSVVPNIASAGSLNPGDFQPIAPPGPPTNLTTTPNQGPPK